MTPRACRKPDDGESTIIPSVTRDFCSDCNELILAEAVSRRTMNLILEFNMQDASIVEHGFITGVRKKLGLDQWEAAYIFCAGGNASSCF